ncbi:MAG: hypothetical protein DIU80_009155 [Chloroflexota bacterium]
MLHVTRTDQVLVTEALACLDEALRTGRLDPDRRELQVLALPSGGRLLVGRANGHTLAVLRRDAPDTLAFDRLLEDEGVVAAVRSRQSGRRALAALMIRLLALQVMGM